MKEKLINLHSKIDTPALLIDKVQLEQNIHTMQKMVSNYNSKLRPHTKTHKSIFIAKKQIEADACGITVAKLSEAEVMADAGIKDIFIANQITHPIKLKRLVNLHKKVDISVGLDNSAHIDMFKKYFSDSQRPLNILIEIDSGLHRCGVIVNPHLAELAKAIINTSGLRLKGIFTHAGHSYSANSYDEVKKIGDLEGKIMEEAYTLLKVNGIEIETISVGSTPTVPFSVKNQAVTEIRPGNYVFYDNIQVHLESCTTEQCSLFVLSTVISQPAGDRIVIDAGNKSLHLDKGKQGSKSIPGYGRLLNIDGEIVRLS